MSYLENPVKVISLVPDLVPGINQMVTNPILGLYWDTDVAEQAGSKQKTLISRLKK